MAMVPAVPESLERFPWPVRRLVTLASPGHARVAWLPAADGRGGRGAQAGPELGARRPAGLRLHDPQAGALQRLGQVTGLLEPLVGQPERGGEVVQAGAVRG